MGDIGRRRFSVLLTSILVARAKAFAVDKLTKNDVDYRGWPKGRDRCENCRVWSPPDSCKSVEGKISPTGWCNIWRPAVIQNAISPDPEGRLTKDDVAYQAHPRGSMRCNNCNVFLPPDECNSVQGKVSPNGWCNIWREMRIKN